MGKIVPVGGRIGVGTLPLSLEKRRKEKENLSKKNCVGY